jgi:hypothetical protein
VAVKALLIVYGITIAATCATVYLPHESRAAQWEADGYAETIAKRRKIIDDYIGESMATPHDREVLALAINPQLRADDRAGIDKTAAEWARQELGKMEGPARLAELEEGRQFYAERADDAWRDALAAAMVAVVGSLGIIFRWRQLWKRDGTTS